MSGPKRADVQAELGRAHTAAQLAASRIAAADLGALEGVLEQARSALGSASDETGRLEEAVSVVDSAGQAVSAATTAREAIGNATASMKNALASVKEAERQTNAAVEADRCAQHAFERARQEYERAEAAMRRAGGHYLRDQMAWAQSARKGFEEATQRAVQAKKAREKARHAAAVALRQAEACGSAVDAALSEARAVQHEAEERARAEAEAARIAQEALRIASEAVGSAASAVSGLDPSSTDKFKPGRRQALLAKVDEGRAMLRAGDPLAAQVVVAQVEGEVTDLRSEVSRLRTEFDARKALSESALGELSAVIQAADPELIATWADDPKALDKARAGLTNAQTARDMEQFGQATDLAVALEAAVTEATASASAAKAADERRTSVGDAVMDVLEELGFDVSFEPGTRTEPLRIAGQTASPDGRGDFDIEIPLDGEVDFEVTAQAGDVSCAGTVASLQERLAARGVEWRTTDWGYGHEPTDGLRSTRERQEVRRQVRTRGGNTQNQE